MKVAFGCDHAGFALKRWLIEKATAVGHEIVDCGAMDERPSDYPDFTAWLVREGIDSISLNPDVAISTAIRVAETEASARTTALVGSPAHE